MKRLPRITPKLFAMFNSVLSWVQSALEAKEALCNIYFTTTSEAYRAARAGSEYIGVDAQLLVVELQNLLFIHFTTDPSAVFWGTSAIISPIIAIWLWRVEREETRNKIRYSARDLYKSHDKK